MYNRLYWRHVVQASMVKTSETEMLFAAPEAVKGAFSFIDSTHPVLYGQKSISKSVLLPYT